MEALVNEVFQDVSDAPDGLDNMNARIRPLTRRCRLIIKEFWKDASDGEHVRTLKKYQMALLFASKSKLDEGNNPYQDAKLLVQLRNRLVHFRPKQHIQGQDDGEFDKALARRFSANPLVLRSSQVSGLSLISVL